MTWHCDPPLVRRYLDGELPLGPAASVEAHLIGCADCRALVAEATDPVSLAPVWDGVRATIERPRPSILRRLGVRENDVVLLRAAQLLRGPWTFATVAVLTFAIVAAWGSVAGQAAYLLVAPLVPVLGVAGSFAATDPLNALTHATPYSKIRLTLLRAVAVVATTVPLVVGLGAILPGIGWLSVAWLGPALGLTLLALVALTWWSPAVTTTGVSVLWAGVIGVAYQRHDLTAAIEREAQLGYLLVAVLLTAALVARIRSAHTPGGYA